MKAIYLTSSPTGTYRSNEPVLYQGFNPENGFVEELKKDWTADAKCLLISATPNAYDSNEMMREYFDQILTQTGLSHERMVLCDDRNAEIIMERVLEYDFILLGGGHVPTQNAFFQKIGLKQRLKEHKGILMGISAGSMNCAEEVYAQPEEPGEAKNPHYKKYLQGLALTKINVLPHYQAVKDDVIDGLRLMEDITYADSFGKEFYLLVDGSYILKRGEKEELHGEGYLFKNGIFAEICKKGQTIPLPCIIMNKKI